jgi:hypothetical protein
MVSLLGNGGCGEDSLIHRPAAALATDTARTIAPMVGN